MTTTASPVMIENKDVKRLIGIMNNPRELVTLIHQMDNMEGQLAQALRDLDTIKEQLAALQHRKKPFQQEYQNAVRFTKDSVQKAQDSFASVKKTFLDNVKKAVDAAKTKGAAGIEKALDLMGVKTALLKTQENINRSIQSAEQSIDKVHALGGEYHAIGYHAKRMMDTLTGKEVSGGINGNGKLNKLLKSPFELAKKAMENAKNSVVASLSLIDKIEKTAQRGRDEKAGSIKEQLDSFKPAAPKAAERGNKDLAHER